MFAARQSSTADPGARPSRSLQLASMVLPVVKCALCPLCLGLLGPAVAGTGLGFLEDERWHGAAFVLAAVGAGVILGLARRHHRQPGPLALGALAVLVALAGHLSELAPLEVAGYAGLMAAGLWNVILLRRQRARGDACCRPARATLGASP